MHCYLGSSRMFVAEMCLCARAREKDKSNDTLNCTQNTDESVRKRRVPVPEFSSNHLPQFKRNLFWLPPGIHDIYYMYMCIRVRPFVWFFFISFAFVLGSASHLPAITRINTAHTKKYFHKMDLIEKSVYKKSSKSFPIISLINKRIWCILSITSQRKFRILFLALQQQIMEHARAHTRVSSGRNGMYMCSWEISSCNSFWSIFFRLCQPTKNTNILLQYSGGRMSCSSIRMVSCAHYG